MDNNTKEEIRKKILTTTIGSLARFEKYFGYLWGYGKEELTAEEERMLDYWEEARYEILNLGNQQIRSLDGIPITFKNKYHYDFKLRNNQGEDYEK